MDDRVEALVIRLASKFWREDAKGLVYYSVERMVEDSIRAGIELAMEVVKNAAKYPEITSKEWSGYNDARVDALDALRALLESP